MKRPASVLDLTESTSESNNSDESENVVFFGTRGTIGAFLNGAVCLTQSSNAPYDDNKISFDEVLRVEGLQKCILTSYVIDEDWLFPKLVNVPRAILCYDNGQHGQCAEVMTMNRRLTIVHPSFPKFPNYGVMHCKLMLCFYPDYLRLVISSGNLVPYDYDLVQNVPHA